MNSIVYFDTAPIIYFLEGPSRWNARVDAFLCDGLQKDFRFVTSVITNIEYLVLPTRNQDLTAINNYWEFLRLLDFEVVQVDAAIADTSAKLRARYAGLKTADAIQLAACLNKKCHLFLTNDKQLLQVREAPVKLVEEL